MKSTRTSRSRRVAAVSIGALVALTGAFISTSAANAVTQTPDPAENFSVLHPSTPVNRIVAQDQTATITNSIQIKDANGNTVLLPKVNVVGDSVNDPAFWPDVNNTNNTPTPYGTFYYVPSTNDLVSVGTGGATVVGATVTTAIPAGAYDQAAASSLLESLTPGEEFDVIIAQTPFNTDGTAADRTVLQSNEGYYLLPYQFNGLNTTTGDYETGPVGSPVNTPPAPAADTQTVLAATADNDGGVDLSATVEDSTGATDTTATGNVTFSAAGLPDVTAPVTNGVATATVSRPTTSYATAYSFTAAYAGDASFSASTSTAQSVTTSAAPPNSGQAKSPESVTIPAPAAGTLTLSVATGGVAFGTATESTDLSSFSASAPLPESTVTDTRFTKDQWTLNGNSTPLTSGSDSIPASDLGWGAPTVTGTEGAVAGPAATDLSQDQPLATFAGPGSAGSANAVVDATLALTTPVDQAQGDYTGVLTITLI